MPKAGDTLVAQGVAQGLEALSHCDAAQRFHSEHYVVYDVSYCLTHPFGTTDGADGGGGSE